MKFSFLISLFHFFDYFSRYSLAIASGFYSSVSAYILCKRYDTNNIVHMTQLNLKRRGVEQNTHSFRYSIFKLTPFLCWQNAYTYSCLIDVGIYCWCFRYLFLKLVRFFRFRCWIVPLQYFKLDAMLLTHFV